MIYIACWGAILSTILAIVKLWEVWRNRFRIDIGYGLNTSPETGNQIYVRNLANHPILIEYWEVLAVSGRWPLRRYSLLVLPGERVRDVRIEAHSSYTLTFRDEKYFSFSPNALKDKKNFIRLHIAGKKPITRLVYGNGVETKN